VFKSRSFVRLVLLAQEEPIQLIPTIQAQLLAPNAQLVHSVHRKDFQPQLHVVLATFHLLVLANVLCASLANFALRILKLKPFRSHKLALEFIAKSVFITKLKQESATEWHV